MEKYCTKSSFPEFMGAFVYMILVFISQSWNIIHTLSQDFSPLWKMKDSGLTVSPVFLYFSLESIFFLKYLFEIYFLLYFIFLL